MQLPPSPFRRTACPWVLDQQFCARTDAAPSGRRAKQRPIVEEERHQVHPSHRRSAGLRPDEPIAVAGHSISQVSAPRSQNDLNPDLRA